MTIEIPMRREGQLLIEGRSIPEPNSGCWLWLGTASKGYGYLKFNGKMRIASRVSHLVFKDNPGDLDVCHTCDNTYCVNPDHLFLGNAQANMDDREAKGRTWKKLTNEQVGIIRSSKAKGCDLAAFYGVSQSLISIVRNKKWRAHQ